MLELGPQRLTQPSFPAQSESLMDCQDLPQALVSTHKENIVMLFFLFYCKLVTTGFR